MSMQGQDRRSFFAFVRRVFGRATSRAEPEQPARPDSPGRDRDGAPDLWKEPVPVARDREGHLHLLL